MKTTSETVVGLFARIPPSGRSPFIQFYVARLWDTSNDDESSFVDSEDRKHLIEFGGGGGGGSRWRKLIRSANMALWENSRR